MACDPRQIKAYNIPAKNIRINRDQYKVFAKSVLDYHLMKHTEVLEYIKLWIKYAILIKPSANILLDDYDPMLRKVQHQTQKCAKAREDSPDSDI